jgi:hypothetical protein
MGNAEPIDLAELRAFKPLPGSPALKNRFDLRASFGLDIGRHDFLKTPFSKDTGVPLGAIN